MSIFLSYLFLLCFERQDGGFGTSRRDPFLGSVLLGRVTILPSWRLPDAPSPELPSFVIFLFLTQPTYTDLIRSLFTAWQAACISTAPVNGTLLDATRAFPDTFKAYKAKFAITVPSDWDGPFGQELNMGATVVTVIVGALLGGSLIGVLCTM